jgi:arginyl-tRNA synthetase
VNCNLQSLFIDMLLEHKKRITQAFDEAAAQIVRQKLSGESTAKYAIVLDRPRQAEHGDLAVNVAMQLAKPLQMSPRDLAAQLCALVSENPITKSLIASTEIAGPGFINMRLSDGARHEVVTQVLTQKERYGRSDFGADQSVLLEFVSANPTGPLHVGHARQAALGDLLASVLFAVGYKVSREFYYNDAGQQINNLALSVQARLQGIGIDDANFPENGYRGAYIQDIADDFLAKKTVSSADVAPITGNADSNDLEAIRLFSVAYLRNEQDLDLKAFGVRFDRYYLESSLYSEGKVEQTVKTLIENGKTYEEGGALWFKSTDYGDDKDRVMRKTEGGYTYFVPDIAYHMTKWQRGFAQVINIQGSDHHGTIARVRAGLQATQSGIPEGYPDYILHKMVRVMKGGEEVKMSKRAGTGVTLRDLIDMAGDDPQLSAEQKTERGRDAVRFFLGSRKADSEYVFDVDLALSRSDENPVYYIQYAHARICRVINDWVEKEGGTVESLSHVDLTSLTAPTEKALMARLAEFSGMLINTAQDLSPHALSYYLKEVAADFHTYYNAERVFVEQQEIKLARLALWAATRQVIRNGLALMGVSAPEKM